MRHCTLARGLTAHWVNAMGLNKRNMTKNGKATYR